MVTKRRKEKATKPGPVAVERFPIVGIGASAGGLAAFEAFFAGLPAGSDPGMAFVLVQHLAPDHKSILTELIRRYTRMQVFEVEDGMKVQANCAYIIPPNRDMAFLNGTLQLLEPMAPRGRRMPIDFFFRSLAQDQHERAIGIVLSGTGSDGTLGVRAIKAEGGMVMVQSVGSTEYDGMPRSAIATGMVDYERTPAEMGAQLLAYAAQAFGKEQRSLAAVPAPLVENAMKKIFILLRDQTGHDFSLYKPSTIHRRIERRMAVHQIESMGEYVRYLQKSPAEVEALFGDLLIGVTSFFRDPVAFEALEAQVIPRLFAGKPVGAVIRVWSAGCSTGEEAYSIAILLAECQAAMKQNFMVQIFATDIDRQAIATARAGLYPASIATDVPPEHLARYFTVEPAGNGYRVHKTIRDMVIFSEQDVIKDPPFSRLDLLICRNLLIYLGSELQKKLMTVFHYALNPGGFLFLGNSETVGEFHDLFATLERNLKLYQHSGSSPHGRHMVKSHLGVGGFRPARTAMEVAVPIASGLIATGPMAGKMAGAGKMPLRELTEQALLQQIAPAGALVSSRGDVFYIHGRTGQYLEPAAGESGVNNILKMAREGLREDLTLALRDAVSTGRVARRTGARVKINSQSNSQSDNQIPAEDLMVNLTVRPLLNPAGRPQPASLYLVILEEAPAMDVEPSQHTELAEPDGPAKDDERLVALRRELHAKEEYLQATNEELETANEELKSSNEEMQSVNEELQSTNEELETSKEEMQSLNEELATVNGELQTKVADLSRVNDDMNNLLAGTGIGTVFVDHQLRILRFTPAATIIINLIPGDVGRPVGHLVPNLVGYDSLVADAQTVLDSLIPKTVEVQTRADRWYSLRILPYRTLENVIEGVVITFLEITEMVLTREALRKANDLMRMAVVVRDSRDAITVQALDGRFLAWNPGAVRIYGWSEAEALTMNVRERIPMYRRSEALARLEQLTHAEILVPYRTERIAKDGRVLEVSMMATALVNEAGRVYAVATTERTGEFGPGAGPGKRMESEDE